ncbi:MAG: glyoxalase/bleomycin resistance/dioxygenase family protein [Inquilinus sp.]|nr:glyoxalase/bleomycin resistance/dioxygenase family protein [Inquilinus sp.]
MQRLHVNLAVEDLDRSIAFYRTLFGAEPTVRHADYAKWMLDDPRVNFALAQRGRAPGVDHLGIQVDSAEELAAVTHRLAEAGQAVVEQHQTECCYARSDKTWATDPTGVPWETFHTTGDLTTYGKDSDTVAPASACCGDTPCGTEATAEAERCCV